MAIKYLNQDKSIMTRSDGRKIELLWGDRVRVISINGAEATVHARGYDGTIDSSALGDESLLEFYFIDVGQGDGVLIRTPDDRHILIDGGFNRSDQPTGKNAADFVDWKFHEDYEMQNIELDAMMVSHNDADHYGGLWDLLNPNPAARRELDCQGVSVEDFYHAGLGWWQKPTGSRWLGTYETVAGEKFFTQVMSDRASLEDAVNNSVPQGFAGEWGQFMASVSAAVRRDGTPTAIHRLSNLSGFVLGFAPAASNVSLKVLGPVEHDVAGKPGIRRLSSADSINTNGCSILLRADYGKVRMILTGDLNSLSQKDLLKEYQGQVLEFACDVAKACHHGSEDVSFKFLQALQPAATIISSGDSNGHDHPRPSTVGASAVTGFLEIDSVTDRLISPLIYSTEIARSVDIKRPEKLWAVVNDASTVEISGTKLDKSEIGYKKNGELRRKRLNDKTRIVAGLVYGLVNVRTNGDKILFATLNEVESTWDIKVLNSRF
ncbi:MAG: MBL fold metallo-hydrolase [Pyrinomonadaceae bacterium]